MSWCVPLWCATFVLALASYWVLRHGTRWGEQDTAQLTAAILNVFDQHTLTPERGAFYKQGYLLTAATATLAAFSGLSAVDLQRVANPLTTVLVVFPALAFLREVCAGWRSTVVAAVLLFTQSEFMFVMLRGSHERIGRTLMLVTFWLLVRSFRFRDDPRAFAAHVILLYLCAYGLIATNVFFGISFCAAVVVAMLGAWLTARLLPKAFGQFTEVARRLVLVSGTLFVLGYMFTYQLFPPAADSLLALQGSTERVAALVLNFQPSSSPYRVDVPNWPVYEIYLLLNASNVLLLVGGTLVWFDQLRRWVLRPTSHGPALSEGCLWFLFAAFGVQGLLGILLDHADIVSPNLQYRAFPSFAMLGAAMLANGLNGWLVARWRMLVLAGVLSALALLSLLKATLEPAVSNIWLFYTPGEARALGWADAHIGPERIWSGTTERLYAAYVNEVRQGARPEARVDPFERDPTTRLLLFSPAIESHMRRTNVPSPATSGANLVYDNGEAQVYRLRADSAFQR